MKKIIWLAAVVCCVLLLTACGSKLPEGFEKDAVLEAADAVIAIINTGDFDAVVLEMREDLRSAITAEQLEEVWGARLDELGAYEKVKDSAVQGTKGQDGEEYAVAAVACGYENGTAVYTLSFDKDYALVGLYMK